MQADTAGASRPSIALCTMVRNEAPSLLEWLAFHELCGVSLFRIYDDRSDDGTPALLDSVANWFPIERIPWSAEGFGRQTQAYQDGADALAGRVTFAAFVDVDEFLFDPALRPLPVALADFAPDVAAVAVNQTVFGSNWHDVATYAPVIQRFTRRAADDYAEHTVFKTIARPEVIASFNTQHAVRLRGGGYVLGDGAPFETAGNHPGHATRIAASGLRLNHYMLKSLEEFRRKQDRGAVADRPDVGYRRFTDDYFLQRARNTNAVEDTTLLALAPHLAERMSEALSAAPGPMGA